MVRRSTWIILGIFILLLASLLIYQRVSENKAEENSGVNIDEMIDEQPVRDLFEITPNAFIMRLRLEGPEDSVVEIVRTTAEGDWLLVDPTGDADQEVINRAVDQVSSLEIEETLGAEIGLSLLGLEEPSNALQLQISNGSEFTLYIGVVTITNTSYYARLAGGPPLVVSKYPLDTVLNWLIDPPVQVLPASSSEE